MVNRNKRRTVKMTFRVSAETRARMEVAAGESPLNAWANGVLVDFLDRHHIWHDGRPDPFVRPREEPSLTNDRWLDGPGTN